MKINKSKKESNKFDLEKMKFAKLKNMHVINGGQIGLEDQNPDPATGTATSKNCNRKKDQE